MDCKKQYRGVRDLLEIKFSCNSAHTHKHKAVDIDGVVTEFARLKGSRLTLFW